MMSRKSFRKTTFFYIGPVLTNLDQVRRKIRAPASLWGQQGRVVFLQRRRLVILKSETKNPAVGILELGS